METSRKVCTFLLAFIALSSDFVVVGRPQGLKNQNDRGTNFIFTPAVRPSILFIRPIFDRQSRLIHNQTTVDEEVVFRERLSNNNDIVVVPTTTTAPAKNNKSRNSGSFRFPDGPVGFVNFSSSTRSPQLAASSRGDTDNDVDVDDVLGSRLSLSLFGHGDILAVSKMLRSQDRNQAQFINIGRANAGLLPLVNEDLSAPNLFPPLRAAQKTPK